MGLEGPKSRGGLSQEGTLSDLVPIHADYIGLGLLARDSTKIRNLHTASEYA